MRRLALGLVFALGGSALQLGALPAQRACAGPGPRAVLVVDPEGYGGRPLRMCVELHKRRVTGLELIQLAGAQYDLQYRFGHGGGAVCQLANVPREDPPEDCLRQGHPYWGYWRGAGGSWSWSSSGAGSTVVENGDVEGWSFGMGSGPKSHPRPPATRFSDVCRRSSPPDGKDPKKKAKHRPKDGGGGKKSPGGTRPKGGGPKGPEGERGGLKEKAKKPQPTKGDRKEGAERKKGPRKKGKAKQPKKRTEPSVADAGWPSPTPIDLTTPTPDALPATATSRQDDDEGSFPVMGIVALVIAAAMGTTAAAIAFRRRRKEQR